MVVVVVPPPLVLEEDEVGCEPGIVVKSVLGKFAVLIVGAVGHAVAATVGRVVP